MIQAKIIADSINPFGHRITTMVVTMPRIVLSEFNTHRMFSRNSASSRAIPFEKMVKSVKENPFIPIAWQKDHKGMQGTEYLTGDFEIQEAIATWLITRDKAVHEAKNLNRIGATKQLCNRLLEPFMYHTVIVTATEWENFFKLRCPKYHIENIDKQQYFRSKKDAEQYCMEKGENIGMTNLDWLQLNESQAEIHIQAVAEAMWDAYNESTPKQLEAGEWHIPFGDNIPYFESNKLWKLLNKEKSDDNPQTEVKVKIATARCARVSYTVIGENKEHDYEADIKLHDKLMSSGHWSPFEHCAKAMSERDLDNYLVIKNGVTIPGMCDNFQGFISYRSLLN
jgi:thymidylate synthase ThyX